MVEKGRRRSIRVVYLAAAVVAVVGFSGYVVGVLTIGTFTYNPHQTSVTGSPSPPPGVSFPLATEVLVTATSSPAAGACTASNLGTPASPTALTSGTSTTVCLTTSPSGYALGDSAYVVEVSWNASAASSTTFEVEVFFALTPSSSDIIAASYVQTSATISGTEIGVFAIDLTQSGAQSLNGFNVIVTQD